MIRSRFTFMALSLLSVLAIIHLASAQVVRFFGEDDAIHDEAHIKEHLKNKIDVNETSSEHQKRFRYFWISDLNIDGKLDGIELMKALVHSHDGHLAEIYTDEKVEELVDRSLNSLDLNRDGWIDFAEYMKATSTKSK